MTKRKKKPTLEDILARPWCYYCERDFDDNAVLISHQKAKHFKCEKCNRRLQTVGGLAVHMNQVHKETLTQLENTLPNRNDMTTEIFAMEGIPQDVMDQHRQRIIRQYYETHSLNGAGQFTSQTGENANKRVKTEDKEALKKRLADFVAKKKTQGTEASSNGRPQPSTGEAPPVNTGSPGPLGQQPQHYGLSSSPAQYGQQQPYGAPPGYPPGMPPPAGGNAYGAESLPSRPMATYQNDAYQAQPSAGTFATQAAPSQDPRLNRSPLPFVRPSSGTDTPEAKNLKSPEPSKDTPEGPTAKKSKKESARGTKLIFNDESTSPEEKMAQLPRYAFDPRARRRQAGLENAVQPSVTGAVVGEDDVMDAQG